MALQMPALTPTSSACACTTTKDTRKRIAIRRLLIGAVIDCADWAALRRQGSLRVRNLTDLGIIGLSAEDRADLLATKSVHDSKGVRALQEFGPLRRITLSGTGEPAAARSWTVNEYDAGCPPLFLVSCLPMMPGASARGSAPSTGRPMQGAMGAHKSRSFTGTSPPPGAAVTSRGVGDPPSGSPRKLYQAAMKRGMEGRSSKAKQQLTADYSN
ncbi:hypothetical protein ACIBG6_07405 [Streptomyces sp. NPDC050842]|uniref:hypothetical protein n=1 Tax=Streptomyces sp. NPDC050842 TaxID=3365636 RepID=UPI00378E58C4